LLAWLALTRFPLWYYGRDTRKVSMSVTPLRSEAPVREAKLGCSPGTPCRRLVLVASYLLLLSFAAQLLPQIARAQAPDQLKVKGYVSDFASVLSPAGRDQINALCAEVDQQTQAQIAVVTIKTLDGKPIEEFSIDLATRLGVGPKQSSRGVLILAAVNDHQYRIEVGYGLEGILPDGKVGGIGREAVPYLRRNDYDAALLRMTRRVADVIAADRGVTLTGSLAPARRLDERTGAWSFGQVFLFLFVLFFVFAILRRPGGGRGSGLNRFGGGGWWIGPTMGGSWGGGFRGGGAGGFGGFGGGSFGGGGAGGSW
jgi:uncharacterized protein